MRTILAAVMTLAVSACATSGVEVPGFTATGRIGELELRAYPSMLVAETAATGDAVAARYSGFSPLADYIFAKDRKGEEIAMTAPVIQESAGKDWRIAFTMPASYSLETLPATNDPTVRLEQVPPRLMAVHRYNGVADARAMDRETKKLLADVKAAGFTSIGEPVHAFYDPPWTLPFFRRNEVMIELAR